MLQPINVICGLIVSAVEWVGPILVLREVGEMHLNRGGRLVPVPVNPHAIPALTGNVGFENNLCSSAHLLTFCKGGARLLTKGNYIYSPSRQSTHSSGHRGQLSSHTQYTPHRCEP
jgi:hypothetical protein